ncbi:MAG: translation initiation factor IF-2, partial [Desulfitobacteriaceae bacterium]
AEVRPMRPRPGMEGRPQGPRLDAEGRPMGPRPGMEGRPQGPRLDAEGRPIRPRAPMGGGPMAPRPPMEGRPMGPRAPMGGGPMAPRPPMEGRPMGQRAPMGGGPMAPRPPMEGRPMGQRAPMGGGPMAPRPGMGQRPPGQRPSSAPVPATTSAIEQPTKRQVPGQKKAQDKKVFDKRREAEKELRSPHKRNFRPPIKEIKDSTPKNIVIPETITVQDLASKMSRKASEVIVKLMKLGVMATINQELDAETATIIASEMGVTVEVKIEKSRAVIDDIVDEEDTLIKRPPVVTVMGHVDHGKTSLLDAIRTTKVTASEAGGITQHIGAYQVEINGQKITFLDTPGHEAFTAMRARGAQVTDIAVLVVAADDGVMPQTIEAINHAKAAGVPIIVAINKIDKENAVPDKVKQELTEYGLVVEEWGGDTIAVPVSAKTKYNIEHLLEMILLVAEVKELTANPNRTAAGSVVEAELDKGKGPVATVLVAKGTLNVGDVIVAGCAFGRIRGMIDDKGRRVKKAGPSLPVEVQGLSEVPGAGDPFYVVADEKLARQIIAARLVERKASEAKQIVKVSLEDLFERIKDGEVKELNIIIKADVQGSVEALQQSLQRLSTSEVRVNPIHGGVGAITETDVMLAAASNAIILGFNVRPDSNTKATAEIQGVDVRLYRVIYDAIDDIKAAMTGLLDPDYKEVILGKAKVRQVFKVPKAGNVAGSYVTEGKITRASKIRVIRDGIVIHEGSIESLRRFKDDVKEVAEGYEFGIGVEKFNDVKEDDIIEAYIMEEVKRQL